MAEKNSLWKNIRNKAAKNKRTGATPKKPTAEMLRQERKIKSKQYADGGYMYAEGGTMDPPDGGPGFIQPTRADSLFLLNNNAIINDFIKNKNYRWDSKVNIYPSDWGEQFKSRKTFFDKGIVDEIRTGEKKRKPDDYRRKRGQMIGTSDWLEGGFDDYGLPFQYIHPNITPQYSGDLRPNDSSFRPSIGSYGYDDLAITPWDMLNEKQRKERIEKYGTAGTPPQDTRKLKPNINKIQSKRYLATSANLGNSEDMGITGNVQQIPTVSSIEEFQPSKVLLREMGNLDRNRLEGEKGLKEAYMDDGLGWRPVDYNDYQMYKEKYPGADTPQGWIKQKADGGYMYDVGGPFNVNDNNPGFETLTESQKALLQKGNNLEKVQGWYEQNPDGMRNFQSFMDEHDADRYLNTDTSNFDEAKKNTNDWYKSWYTKRAQIPRYTEVSNKRLGLLNEGNNAQLIDPVNYAFEYWKGANRENGLTDNEVPETFHFPSKMYGSFDPLSNKVFANSRLFDGELIRDKNGKLISPLLTHEFSHQQEYHNPQIGTTRHLSKDDWNNNHIEDILQLVVPNEDRIADPGTEGGVYNYYYQPTEVRSRLNVWRQLNDIDPTKDYTNEELKSIIDKNIADPNNSRDIQELYNIIKNDPEKLKTLNDYYVSNKTSPEFVQRAAEGGYMYNNGGFIGEDGDGKRKPTYLSPAELGGRQIMEPSTTSTNVPNIVRMRRDPMDRPEIYAEQARIRQAEIAAERKKILEDASRPGMLYGVKPPTTKEGWSARAQKMAARKVAQDNTPLDQKVKNFATEAAFAFAPEVLPFLSSGRKGYKIMNQVVNDVPNQLPGSSNQSVVNLSRSSPKPKSDLFKKTEDLSDETFSIQKKYRGRDESSRVIPKEIDIKGKSGFWNISRNTDGTFSFHASMANPIESGRALKKLDTLLPSKPVLHEQGSLSLDSYPLLLNMSKRPNWSYEFADYITLNKQHKNSKLFSGIESEKSLLSGLESNASYTFKDKAKADEAVRRINELLQNKNFTEKAEVIKNNETLQDLINKSYTIKLPNYKFTRDYKQGGYMYDDGGGVGKDGKPVTLYKKAEYNSNTDKILEYAGSEDNKYYVTPNTPQGIDFESRLPEFEIIQDTGLYNPDTSGYRAPRFIPSETGLIPNPNYYPLATGALDPVYPEMAMLPGALPIKATSTLGKIGVGLLETAIDNPGFGLGSVVKNVGKEVEKYGKRVLRHNTKYNPVSNKIKDIGTKIARINSDPYRNTDQILRGVKGENSGNYYGQIADDGDIIYGAGARDLNSTYFKGSEAGLEKTNYDISKDPGLKESINWYGDLNSYLLNSRIPHGENIDILDFLKSINYYQWNEADGFNTGKYFLTEGVENLMKDYPGENLLDLGKLTGGKKIGLQTFTEDQLKTVKDNIDYLFSKHGSNKIPFEIGRPNTGGAVRARQGFQLFDNNPIHPIDDIAGHMGFLEKDPVTGGVNFTTRDIWGFRPQAYLKKYAHNNYGQKIKPFSKEALQVHLMDSFGKPFVLHQTNPIKFKDGGYTNPYNYYSGGPMEYKVGGKVWQGIGNALYGAGAGLASTVTGGLTKPFTDKGQDYFQKLANPNFDPTNPDDVKAMRQIDTAGGAGQIAGAITGAIIDPTKIGSAIATGTDGINDIIYASEASDDVKKWSQGISGVAQLGHMMNGSIGSSSSAPPSSGGDSANISEIGGQGSSAFGDVLTNFSGTEFGKNVEKAMPFANQAIGMLGDNQGSLLEQGYAKQKELNSPEYLAMKEMQNQQYVNQGLSFATGGYMYSDGGKTKVYSDPNEFKKANQAYNDSLMYFNAMQVQNELMGDNGIFPKGMIDTVNPVKYNTESLNEIKNLNRQGIISMPVYSTYDEMLNSTTAKKNKDLIKAYRRLGIPDENIGFYNSPDLYNTKIRPVASYYDGEAFSPYYKEPVVKPVLEERNLRPNIDKLQSKRYTSDSDNMSIIGSPQQMPTTSQMSADSEGHYRTYKIHTHGEPIYQVWEPGKQWRDVSNEEFEKINSEKYLTEYKSTGGNITNNSLNLQSMKGRYQNYKQRMSKGGTFNQYGIDFIPKSAGLHHESAYGGVTVGSNSKAEGGEINMDTPDGGQYIVSDRVDGAESQMDFTFSKGGKYKELNRTLADGMKQDLNKYSMGSLATNSNSKDDVKRPFDSLSEKTINQIKQKWQQKTEFARQRSQQEQAIAQAEEQKRLIEEEYIAAYGGKINPKKYPGLNRSKKSKGGYVYNAMTQPMLAQGGPLLGGDKNQPWTNPIPIGSTVQQGTNSVLSAGYGNKDAANTEFGSRIINEYGNGLPNDTSYIYQSNRMGNNPGTEDYFYNTGQNTQDGKPISNYNSGSVAPLSHDVYKQRIQKLAGYAQGGPMVSNIQQPFNGPAAQNRGGMMMADGGMMQQQQMQQQGGQDQMMQLIQAYADAVGVSPEEIIQGLQQMDPQEQKQAIDQMAQELQGGQQQSMQQQMPPQQGMMSRGGRMRYANGGPEGDPNSLDYITGASDFMYTPEFLNYWTNPQDKRSANYANLYDRAHRPPSEERFKPTEGISDFDRTLGNLKQAFQEGYIEENPDGTICYIDENGSKVCGPKGQIMNLMANRKLQSKMVQKTYQDTTGDMAPYNYNNITGLAAARPQSNQAENQNFTERQQQIRSIVPSAVTRPQSSSFEPIESSYAKSNTAGFIPSDVMANRMGTSPAEYTGGIGPVSTAMPRDIPVEQTARFTPPLGSDAIEDLPGYTANQPFLSDEEVGLTQPNLPKLSFTQSDAIKYNLNPNDVNIIKDPKVKSPNQLNKGLSGLDYVSALGNAAAGIHQLATGLQGADPVNYERVRAEKIDPTVSIILAAEENRRAQDSAAYLMRQSAPTSANYMGNMRGLGLRAGINRGAQTAGLRQAADVENARTQTGVNAQNAQISMQEQIDRLQEKDAARTNITEGLSTIGSSTANMIRDYRINEVNQTIANNIGTPDWKYDPINETITFRNKDGNVVTVPAQTVIPSNVAANVGTGKLQKPRTSQFQTNIDEGLNRGFRNRFKGPNSGK